MTVADILSILGFILNVTLYNLYLLNSVLVCKFIEFWFYVCFDVSYYLTLLLAVERFLAIAKPAYYRSVTTVRCMTALVIIVWIFSAVVLIFMFFVFGHWNGDCISYEIFSKTSYIIIYFVVGSLLSAAACVLYTIMMIVINQHKKQENILFKKTYQSNDVKIPNKKDFNSAIFTCILAVVIEISRLPYVITTYLRFDPFPYSFTLYKISVALVILKPMVSFAVYCVKFKEIRTLLKLVVSFGHWKPQSNHVVIDLR